MPPAGTDGAVTATRPVGDVAKVLVAGRTLVVLTGTDETDVAARLRASRILAPATAATASTPGDDIWLCRPVVLTSLMILLVCVAASHPAGDGREPERGPPDRTAILDRLVGRPRRRIVPLANHQGIVFFQVEHQRVFGLQLDERGRFVPQLSYSYTFNLQEMKAPFITAVTEVGWHWRPTAWHGPSWLRWLTN